MIISGVAVEACAARIAWSGASWAFSQKSSKANNSIPGVCDLIYEHICTTVWEISFLRRPLGVTSFSQCSLKLSADLQISVRRRAKAMGRSGGRKKTPNTLKALERAQKCASRSRGYTGPLGPKLATSQVMRTHVIPAAGLSRAEGETCLLSIMP